MKKLALILSLFMAGNFAFAQNDMASQSRFRFGLKLGPAVNWMKPDDLKKFENDGSSLGFNWGLNGEYALSNNFSFYFGLEINHEKGKIGFTDSAFYFMTDNYDFVETKEENGVYVPENANSYTLLLNSRTYASTYVSLPIGIKMKTNEIGYMTYFGQFGLNLGFRTGTKITDEVDYLGNNNAAADLNDISDVNLDRDMQPLRVQLRVGAGAEYKISEGTSVFGAIQYNLGFTNVVRNESRYLINRDALPLSQKFSAHGIGLTVGVLF